ncbi:MAG: SpoVT/AbrB domain-containing protein, partial [Anabaena sp. CRKS33]
KKLRGLLKDKSPDRNLVDELIQERRQEYLSE